MVSSIYKKTFSVLMKRPFRLWGISLLAEFLCLVAYAGFIGVPAAAFCAALLLSASMSMIFLNSYRTGLEPKTAYLFASFKKDRILRVLGGMAWMQLWIFLWSLIPIVGIVFGIIRMYEYRFVPYILMTRDDVKPTDAIKISKQETMGYKGKMFGAGYPARRSLFGRISRFYPAGGNPVSRRAVPHPVGPDRHRIRPACAAVQRDHAAGVLCGNSEPPRGRLLAPRCARTARLAHSAGAAVQPSAPVQPERPHPAHTARAVRCSRTACMPCPACCVAFVYRSCDAARFAGSAGRLLPGA